MCHITARMLPTTTPMLSIAAAMLPIAAPMLPITKHQCSSSAPMCHITVSMLSIVASMLRITAPMLPIAAPMFSIIASMFPIAPRQGRAQRYPSVVHGQARERHSSAQRPKFSCSRNQKTADPQVLSGRQKAEARPHPPAAPSPASGKRGFPRWSSIGGEPIAGIAIRSR